jgi:hypothetical protein
VGHEIQSKIYNELNISKSKGNSNLPSQNQTKQVLTGKEQSDEIKSTKEKATPSSSLRFNDNL